MPITADDIRLDVTDEFEDIKKCAKRDGCPEWQIPLFYAAEGMCRRMVREGATEQEANDASFAMGQIVRMRGIERSYDIAAECFNRWKAGHPDKPGYALAKTIIDETLPKKTQADLCALLTFNREE